MTRQLFVIIISALFLLIFSTCKAPAATQKSPFYTPLVQLLDSNQNSEPNLILIDTLIIEGYLLDLRRVKFESDNTGFLLIDSNQLQKFCNKNTDVDLYEYLMGEGFLSVLQIHDLDFRLIKWNLLHPEMQVTDHLMSNVPDSILYNTDFQKDTILGTFKFKMNTYLENMKTSFIEYNGYKINTTRVRVSGFIMKVNGRTDLPFAHGFLERMVIEKYGSTIVFIPMELHYRETLDKDFLLDYIDCESF